MASALAIEGVTKVYGRTTVVDDVSFTVEPQEILGLVGPNGAGKTTTIRMALDIIHPDTGAVALFGSAPTRQALQRIGYLPEERGLYQKAVLRDVLRYLGRLKGLSNKDAQARTDAMLQRVGLYEHRAKKVQALSRGMSQLAQFASALLHLPDPHHSGRTLLRARPSERAGDEGDHQRATAARRLNHLQFPRHGRRGGNVRACRAHQFRHGVALRRAR